ncbi:MAG: response regulator [Planctomycetes bacterium]|nr:response regulator [Planctomycetota bacterium]
MFTAGTKTTKTILLADDENMVREIVTMLLERLGFVVISAVDGNDAVDKFYMHKDHIDMLLFDVTMPGKNGKDAYDTIKKTKPDMKVLFMSGYAENIVSNKYLQEKGVYFLQKPVSSEILFEKINEILGASQ